MPFQKFSAALASKKLPSELTFEEICGSLGHHAPSHERHCVYLPPPQLDMDITNEIDWGGTEKENGRVRVCISPRSWEGGRRVVAVPLEVCNHQFQVTTLKI